MSLKILVCVKQVPSPEHFNRIKLDTAKGSIRRSDIPQITNILDRHALEETFRIRKNFGGSITALTMGPPSARTCLEECLASGADEGILLCDPAFAGSDTLATSAVIAAAIRSKGPFDLVLCGNDSADGGTGHVPVQIAEELGWAHIKYARKIEFESEQILRIERVIEGGFLRLRVTIPVIISVLKRINTYRLPTILGIMEARKKKIFEMDHTDLRLSGLSMESIGIPGSPTRIAGVFLSQEKRHAEMIDGRDKHAAQDFIRKLREFGVL